MNSNRKYQISVGVAAPVDVYPINDDQIEFNHSRPDEDKIFYVRKLKNKLKFSNKPSQNITDFTYFHGFETNPALRCSTFTINIFKKCDGVFVLDWVGNFSLTDADWDLDQCTLTVKVEPVTLYECIKRNKNKEINILDVPNIITASANLDFNYEYFYCYDLPFFASCVLPGVQTGTWTLMYNNNAYPITYQCTNYNVQIRIYYREVVITACVGGTPQPPPGIGWALEQNNCAINQTAKYVRTPVAGPFLPVNFALGWWNYINNTQELPPAPVFKSIISTNTPQSEPMWLTQSEIVYAFGGSPQPVIQYQVEVIPNQNSTYVWSLNPGSPVSASVSGTTSVCLITPTNNNVGIIQVLLTETHGNGYISTKIYNFNQTVASSGFSETLSATIIGPTTACDNQIIRLRCTKPPIVSTGNPSITWTVGGGATILSGQGTENVVIQCATSNFTATAYWSISVTATPVYTIQCTSTQNVSVLPIPSSPPIYAISEVYPTEPQTFFMYNRAGATYDVYRDTTSLGAATLAFGFAFYQENAPALGTHCYLIKEHVNCGCNYVEVVPHQANATIGNLPSVYWCSDTSNDVLYTRNRLLKEVVEYVVDQLGCDINGVVSDFFDWNALGDAPGYASGVNYVLANLGFPVTINRLTNILIAQKSDIISYLSSNPATKGLITFEKLEKLFLYAFNAYWFINGANQLRIEHVSYFNRTVAYNANAAPHAIFNVAKNKYTYDKSKMPKFESYSMAEMMFTDFIGTNIYYDNLCVDQDSSSNVKERVLDFITTDLYALFIDPANANKNGFVLMSTTPGTPYTVNIEVGILSGANITNGHLSWANLHNYYHRHNRVLINGYMNNVLTTFATAKPTKEQKEIIIKFCCDNVFNPLLQLYKTELGNGVLSEADENTQRGTIKMTLLQQ